MALGVYRTKTYIAADFDSDKDAVDQLHKWNDNNYWGLSFNDVHSLTQSRDSSQYCSIKSSLKSRMDVSKTFVIIIGANTNDITKGSCSYCDSYRVCYTKPSYCAKGYSVSTLSYIKYECEQAVKANIKIVVLYKSTIVNKNLCPESIRSIGTHIAMKHWTINSLGQRVIDWDYQAVKNAING